MPKLRMQYTKENLLIAVNEVKSGHLTATAASNRYNIPKPTIRARVKNRYSDKKPGPQTVFSTEEETQIAEWIFESGKTGFPVTKPHLLNTVQTICKKLKKILSLMINPVEVGGKHFKNASHE